MNKFIPIYEYAKLKNTSKQNVYRWIREHKFNADDLTLEKKEVTRIRINVDAIISEKNTVEA